MDSRRRVALMLSVKCLPPLSVQPTCCLAARFIGIKKEQPMSIIDFLLLLLVAGICGTIGQAIAGYSHGGCLVSIALGFIGALVGNWSAGLLNLPNLFTVWIGGHEFPIIWSIVGAALFVAVLGLITSRPPRVR
jgi:uncharacterized membrane protein YeaQ/YmgE (transglycosylase-associated protein family)